MCLFWRVKGQAIGREEAQKSQKGFLAVSSGIRRPVAQVSATCCVADFQIGTTGFALRPAGWEARDTADLEVCATGPDRVEDGSTHRKRRGTQKRDGKCQMEGEWLTEGNEAIEGNRLQSGGMRAGSRIVEQEVAEATEKRFYVGLARRTRMGSFFGREEAQKSQKGFLAVSSGIRRPVAQVSQPAVSPISKSARRDLRCGQRAGKPAIQQTWKSALQAPTAWRTVPPTENVEEPKREMANARWMGNG